MYSETPPEKVTTSGARALLQRRRGAAARRSSALRRCAAHGLEQPVDHALDHALEDACRHRQSPIASEHADLRGEAPAGFLDARNAAVARRTTMMRAPTSMAVMSTTAPPSQTAIFEVPPPISTFMTRAALANRARRRARAEGGERGFERVAGADRDELAGLGGEQIADGARVAPAHRDAGQDQRAGVDRVADRRPASSYCASMKTPQRRRRRCVMSSA